MGAGDQLLGGELAEVPTYGGFRDIQLGAHLGHRQASVLGQQSQQGTPALPAVLGICGVRDAIHADYVRNRSAFPTTGRPMWTPTAPDPSAEAIILT